MFVVFEADFLCVGLLAFVAAALSVDAVLRVEVLLFPELVEEEVERLRFGFDIATSVATGWLCTPTGVVQYGQTGHEGSNGFPQPWHKLRS